jgi:hypothetical protein
VSAAAATAKLVLARPAPVPAATTACDDVIAGGVREPARAEGPRRRPRVACCSTLSLSSATATERRVGRIAAQASTITAR